MDKDWAEKEARSILKFVDNSAIHNVVASALRKVRREAIESCAVTMDNRFGLGYAIRESEGKV